MVTKAISFLADSASPFTGILWLVFGAACLLMGTIIVLLFCACLDVAATDHMLRRHHRDLQYWQNRAMRAEDPNWRQ